MRKDIIRKLTSRKFWVAVTGFITAILVMLKIDELTIEQVISLISSMGVLVAYIIGEGMIDSATAKNIEVKSTNEFETESKEENDEDN